MDQEQESEDSACFIIAEAGVNHNGSIDQAKRLIDVAAQAGADAVKFQTFRADDLVSPQAKKADYQRTGRDDQQSQHALLKGLELSLEQFKELKRHCDQQDIMFLSTPFDAESADALDAMKMEIFKVPSGELTNLPFLAHLAGKGKPMIVSTGMSTLGEVETALHTIAARRDVPVTVLHCVSAYPAPFEDLNLLAMDTIHAAFQVPVGLSDHTLGIEAPIAAVALGAVCIEKHFTLDKKLPGPDHKASLNPQELTAMVQAIRNIEAAMGDGIKAPRASEKNTADVARRSLTLARPVSAGTTLTVEDLVLRRPGDGLPPHSLPFVVGRKVRRELSAGALLCLEDLG